jgi:hypothetical protein
MFLTAVRVEKHDCRDRIVFTFTSDGSGKPGFRAAYALAEQAQTEDGSGRHVDVAGPAFLVVRLEPAATAKFSGERLAFTYNGPRRIEAAGTRYLHEVVKTGDFEAVVTWTIGLSERRPFRAVASTSPPQLVLEID